MTRTEALIIVKLSNSSHDLSLTDITVCVSQVRTLTEIVILRHMDSPISQQLGSFHTCSFGYYYKSMDYF